MVQRTRHLEACCCCCWVISVVSDSVWPHRWQPTRLPCPWNSPGKNTGVGCHFLLQCIKMKSEREVAQSCRTLLDPLDRSLPGSSVHGIFQARVLEMHNFKALLRTAWIRNMHFNNGTEYPCDYPKLRSIYMSLPGAERQLLLAWIKFRSQLQNLP